MKNKLEDEMITKSFLKEDRGWTDKIISNFFPVPDDTKQNPKYKKGPQMCLYRLNKILEAEASEKFRELKAKVKNVNAAQAVETKRKKIIDYVQNLTIVVPQIPRNELIQKACDHYNSYHSGIDKYASPTDDWVFLSRICCNYLRHRCTSYEQELMKIFGKVGKSEAYEILKENVNQEIYRQYDYL